MILISCVDVVGILAPYCFRKNVMFHVRVLASVFCNLCECLFGGFHCFICLIFSSKGGQQKGKRLSNTTTTLPTTVESPTKQCSLGEVFSSVES